jgi:hypothetical protein
MARKPTKTTTDEPQRPAFASGMAGATSINLPAGAGTGGALDLPVGGNATLADTATDVANQLGALAPTFGEILKSVGTGLANAQRALDKSVIDTVNKLASTKIDVVTDVIQRIDDATGLPVEPTDDDLITQKLSVLNFVTPTVHEFKYMALSMDMSISKLDQKTGMSFTSASLNTSRNQAGLHFGFVGVGTTSVNADFKSVRSNTEREMQWASGRVQMDALLAPRRTTKFPVPAEITIGPQIFLAQGKTTDVRQGAGANAPLVERHVEITITTLTASGAVNATAAVTIEAPGLLRETTQPNTLGKTRFRLRRFFTNGGQGFATFPVKVRLGQIVKSFSVDL